MSLLDVVLAAEAAVAQKAIRKTAYRHRALREEPLVVTTYNLAGEAAAPLAFCYGTQQSKPKLVVAPEPRNREIRFAGINEFCLDFAEYVRPYLRTEERTIGARGHERTLEVALDAPQIVVPNRATRDFLAARLGRSLRYLGLGTTHPVPEATQWAGAHLSWLAEHTHLPGQSVFLAATELLGRHFATGQSAIEDENLATLLAWIENAPGSGLDAIRGAEARRMAFGPVADPALDARLERHVQAFGRAVREGDEATMAAERRAVEELVREPLGVAYAATHRALELMRPIPEAASVKKRWEQDLRNWGAHVRRCSRGIPRFARRHDPLRAAKLLEIWSRAQEDLENDEAFDDPLVMAELDAEGRCVCGEVREIDVENREIKPGNTRASLVPIVTLGVAATPQLLEGDAVCWSGDQSVHGEIREIRPLRRGFEVTVAILGGHKSGERLPAEGGEALFVAVTIFRGRSPDDPREVPWTHRRQAKPSASEGPAKIEETPGAEEADPPRTDTEDELGPDLAPEETLPPEDADVEPGEIPGVLL